MIYSPFLLYDFVYLLFMLFYLKRRERERINKGRREKRKREEGMKGEKEKTWSS